METSRQSHRYGNDQGRTKKEADREACELDGQQAESDHWQVMVSISGVAKGSRSHNPRKLVG